jgi:hypothetical protein
MDFLLENKRLPGNQPWIAGWSLYAEPGGMDAAARNERRAILI